MLIGVSGESKAPDKTVAEMNAFDYCLVKPADPKLLMALLDKAQQHG
jgi:hypothetical protein